MAKICQRYIPQNTAECTSWALRVFQSWRDQRNKSVEEQCPDDLLESLIADRLNYGCHASLLKSVARMDGVQGPNFMSRKDPAFRDLTGAVQVRYR